MRGPPCATCGGTGAIMENVRIKVKIPAGVKPDQKIRLRGQGLPGRDGGPPGDLFITIHVEPHPWLRREGDDLFLEVPVTISEAIFGAKIDVPTLDGSVKLTLPPGSQTGQKLRLKGKGVLGKGDLYVTLAVRVPPPPAESDAAKKAAAELEKLYKGDVRAALVL
jgi:molecular chaperone DnaJ